jgi:hypothetical protein
MRLYYPIVDAKSTLIALTQDKTKDALDVAFAEDYLTRLGITLPEGAVRVNIPKGYISFVYKAETKQLHITEELEIYQRVYRNANRTRCEQEITAGVTVNGFTYGTDITDQLAIMQAVVIAAVDGSALVKRSADGQPSAFVSLTLAECQEVNYAIAKHILDQRIQLANINAKIDDVSNSDQLSKLKWSK